MCARKFINSNDRVEALRARAVFRPPVVLDILIRCWRTGMSNDDFRMTNFSRVK